MGVTLYEHGPTPARVAAAFRQAAADQMRAAMAEVEGEVVRRAPFRTGHLRRSITYVVRRDGDRIVGIVGTATRYAPFLEYGTGLYGPRNRRIVPTRARALRFPAGGAASAYGGPSWNIGKGGATFSGSGRRQGFAGPGFRLSGQQRSGRAGANASFAFRRSVRGIHPVRFFADGIEISRGRAHRRLEQIPTRARALLASGGKA